jgi:hypothetical protein
VVDLDAAFEEEFLEVAEGEPVAELPVDGQQDQRRRKSGSH